MISLELIFIWNKVENKKKIILFAIFHIRKKKNLNVRIYKEEMKILAQCKWTYLAMSLNDK